MEKDPLVSVVIPSYNARDYIKETVDSVLAQTYKNIEIFVVDDGSTDDTKEVLSLYGAAGKIHYLYQQNAGQSAARNTAIAHAQGKYIALLDADDLFMPTKIEEQVAYLEAHPECGLSYCRLYHFFGSDLNRRYVFSVPSPSGVLFKELLRGNFINPLSVVLRKELLDKYGAFEPTFRRLDEQALWLKLAFNNVMFCHLPKYLAYYRVHSSSLTNDAVYYRDTQKTLILFLKNIKTSWLSPAQAEEYDIDGLISAAERRYFVGKMMAGNNVLSKMLLKLYNLNRLRRIREVPPSEYEAG